MTNEIAQVSQRITPEDLFGYAFAVVFGIGIAVIAVLFIAALLGFFDKD